MRKYEEELAELEERKLDLTNAEKLFELPITLYPAMMQTSKEMAGMEQVFQLYSQQKVQNINKIIKYNKIDSILIQNLKVV